MQGRPPGVTGNQWSTAGRAPPDLVVAAADTGLPRFAVRFTEPAPDGSPARREGTADRRGVRRRRPAAAAGRVADARWRRAGPPLRRVRPGRAGLRDGTDPDAGDAVGFRDIIGRLPDGRRGPVNDLGALARVEAVEAYVAGRLADPIVRGLHVRWTDGPAEGWGWVEVRPGRCLLERVRLTSRGFTCGVDPGRLAEDLAAMALGERLHDLDAAASSLVDREELRGRVRALAARRDPSTAASPSSTSAPTDSLLLRRAAVAAPARADFFRSPVEPSPTALRTSSGMDADLPRRARTARRRCGKGIVGHRRATRASQ